MLYAIVAVIALIMDQAVKYWTTVNIVVDTGEAKLIPGFIHLANVHNTGAAFSFLEGARWFFVILCLIFTLIVVYALAKNLITHPVCRWSSVIVLAGAIGNCIDRIVCGYVVDMFEFDFLIFNRPFPVFNVADIFITLGVIVFCVALLLEKPATAATAGEKTEKKVEKQEHAPKQAPAHSAAPVEKKPLIRKRQKIEIPVFPKHDLPDVPELDPNDPFAEWEKRANASAPAAPAEPATTVYTQPAAAEAPAPVEPAAPAAAEEPVSPTTPAVPAVPETPAAAPTASVAPVAPKAPSVSADEFDLDSILAEFKDL